MSIIRILDLRGSQLDATSVAKFLPRAAMDIDQAAKAVAPLIERVKTYGAKAVAEIGLEFDGFSSEPILVSQSEIKAAVENLEPSLKAAIEEAIRRNRAVSEATKPKPSSVELDDGAMVSERFVPVDSVGLYAPGGKAVYPSSVVMNVVPAQVAGVKNISVASPGQKDFGGRPHPTVLATAGLLGIDQVYCMGGAAAIAGFAFGLPEIGLDPVAMITGPGNIYVAAAKKLLRSVAAIDSEAGTTEIMIIADDSANAEYVAADLIAQAEHDEAAAAVLVTTSEALIQKVSEELAIQIKTSKHSMRIQLALAAQQSALVLVDSISNAVDISNHYASEHLSIQHENPAELLKGIRSAGAIFIGENSPVSLGDYLAGSNHVLPTGGTARHSSGLSVHTFLKPQQLVEYSSTSLKAVNEKLEIFAKAEDLPAHGEAVSRRFRAK